MSNCRIKGVRYRRAPMKQRVIDHLRWAEKCDCNVNVVVAKDSSVMVTHEKRCWSIIVKVAVDA